MSEGTLTKGAIKEQIESVLRPVEDNPPENMGERLPQNPLIAILEAFYLKPLETRLVKSLGAVK